MERESWMIKNGLRVRNNEGVENLEGQYIRDIADEYDYKLDKDGDLKAIISSGLTVKQFS